METARCKAFVSSVEQGSFSKAADALGYTPSGVSQLVSALEDDIGFSLLTRTTKGVTPTSEGQRLLPAIREFIAQESQIYQLASEIKGLAVGTVSIGSFTSIATHWLPEVISAFRSEYPKIEIKLMEGIGQEVIGWLDQRIADIGFLSYRENLNYEWLPLAEDTMLAVLPKCHPFAGQKSFPVHQCQNERFIMPALGRDEDVVEMFNKFGIIPDIQFSTLENLTTMAMIEQGLGMSIMNELITKNWQFDVAMLPLDPPQAITMGIALPSFKHASPAVKRFVRFAAQRLTKTELT